MPPITITLELPDELGEDLIRIAEALQIADPGEAALIGLADWIAQRKSELGDRDARERYFINEALDELIARKKG